MAFFDIKFYSMTLQTDMDIQVIIPTPNGRPNQVPYYDKNKRYQVLYLLHGASGGNTQWTRFTAIERFAQQHQLAVVCPHASNSFYVDTHPGSRYMTYITKELPTFIQSMFPVSTRREDTFIAGNSMGGFGAFRLALCCPEQYGCAVSLSGALDVISMAKVMPTDPTGVIRFADVFGPDGLTPGNDNDLTALAKRKIQEGCQLPKFYQCCGTEDFLYRINVSMRAQLEEAGLDLTYVESPGIHDWAYWDSQLPAIMEWLPLANNLVDA